MSSKNTPYRFTIRFHEKDYQQRCVAEMLNGMGRHKAQYITAAILHYTNCTKTPDIEQNQDAQMQQKLELMLRMALEKLGLINLTQQAPGEPVMEAHGPKRKHADVLTAEDTRTGLDGLNIDAIMASLSALK